MAQERLQKILAQAGVASRRAAETLITQGEVTVNGKVVTELGARADLDTDRIVVSGKPVGRETLVYFLLHKPRGMVTTLSDPEGRPNLSELLTEIPERVYPIGRLDFHTSGALLLTNDGDLAQALLHPSKEVPKTYVVKLNMVADDRMVYALRSGVTLDDGYRTREASVIPLREEDGKSWLEITITEGKNRQIHRMIEAVGARVMRLARQTFAGISGEGLRPGKLRPLEAHEVAMLLRRYAARDVKRAKSDERPEFAGRSERYDRRQTPRAEQTESARDARPARTTQKRQADERPTRSREERPTRTRAERPTEMSEKRAARTEREPARGQRKAVRDPEARTARTSSSEREPRVNPARVLAAKLGAKSAESAQSRSRKTQDTFDRGRTSSHKKRT